jgi:hypothetical protein
MKHTVEMASDGTIYIPSFMKIGSGIQAILMRGCSVDITNGKNLLFMSLS